MHIRNLVNVTPAFRKTLLSQVLQVDLQACFYGKFYKFVEPIFPIWYRILLIVNSAHYIMVTQ